MPAAFGPLNAHDTQRVYDQINALSGLGLSDADILKYLSESRTLGRSALDDYMNAAGMSIAQSFQPQFDTARNTLGANPLLADSGYANRLNRQLLTDLASRESGAFNNAAADFARGDVGYLQGLRGQQVGLRSNLANQAYNTILNPPQQPSTMDKILGAAGQVGGAVLGGAFGGPVGAADGSRVGGLPGQSFYPNALYGGQYGAVPPGGYSESLPSPMRRTGRY
jgi:hypothetical protein